MSRTNPISALRSLFDAVCHVIPPKAEAELPLMRHEPLDTDSDSAWWSDMRYLHDLRAAILDELREGAFLWDMPIEVYSEALEPNAWPDDLAATQLEAWALSRVGSLADAIGKGGPW